MKPRLVDLFSCEDIQLSCINDQLRSIHERIFPRNFATNVFEGRLSLKVREAVIHNLGNMHVYIYSTSGHVRHASTIGDLCVFFHVCSNAMSWYKHS